MWIADSSKQVAQGLAQTASDIGLHSLSKESQNQYTQWPALVSNRAGPNKLYK